MKNALACVLIIAAACGPRARSADPERRAVNAPPVEAALDVSVGTTVNFAFRVTNNEPRKLEIRFPTGQTHDIVVMDSIGREVWRWSSGRMFTQSLLNRILATNATLAWQATWKSESGRPAPPGRYVAVASLLSENKPLQQRVEFELR